MDILGENQNNWIGVEAPTPIERRGRELRENIQQVAVTVQQVSPSGA